ncbi:hypothetical protein [Cyclobacterium xiamenense]|jgi:hypothetical protein|uniref:hypothetical protein n=1 Tax=Cyclobacterium xiamenense TaxID=1297121 RepID=UPI0012B8B670|nr:hypothetical protein [Cyclobacterium xiamenense]
MMRTSYLDYYKMILEKVSFDYGLVKKELHKANQVLTGEEQSRLRKWMLQNGLLFEAKAALHTGS